MDGRTASDHVADVDVVVCWMQGLHTPREHSNMMSKAGYSNSRQKRDHFLNVAEWGRGSKKDFEHHMCVVPNQTLPPSGISTAKWTLRIRLRRSPTLIIEMGLGLGYKDPLDFLTLPPLLVHALALILLLHFDYNCSFTFSLSSAALNLYRRS